MNNKAVNFIKNFSYTLASNLISLIVSTVLVLIVPKLIGVNEYGYWQLYLFYTSYVGFLHFGWIDGIYLRYGGKEYQSLDKKLFFSQFYMLVLSQLVIALFIFIFSSFLAADIDKAFVLKMTAICIVIMNARYMLLYVLQCTNRIKEYAQITMMDRVLYILLIIILLIAGVREYKLMVIADLTGKLISLLYSMYCCKDIAFRKISNFYFSFREAMANINAGIKLMFANIASLLIIGVVRFGIERTWDVATFGKISLTLSISNFLMLFINAVGIIMFPILRRTDEKKLPVIYNTMRNFLMIVLLGILIVYYPFKVGLSAWLPKYAGSLKYMAILFPMCVFEGKMSLLINTYLKTYRKEKLLLKVNLIALLVSTVTTFITIILMKNLDLAVFSIVALLAFRCVLAETYLSKILEVTLYKDIILELILTFIFTLTGWYMNSWLTLVIYGIAYAVYLIIKRKDITDTIHDLKLLMKA